VNDFLFPDNGFVCAGSKINGFTERKTGLIIPYWLANLFPDGLEYGEMKEGLFWESGIPRLNQ